MRGTLLGTLKDLATKDPEKTKAILNKVKAKVDSISPEDKQKVVGTINDITSKALHATEGHRTKLADAIRKGTEKAG